MKEIHDASVVKFDGVCVDLFFGDWRQMVNERKEMANAGCAIYKIITPIL